MRRIFNKKFPKRLAALDRFLSVALLTMELVPIPTDEDIAELQIRDVKDRPILRAAMKARADVLLTGDMKDSRMLKAGQDFSELQDSYMVFITRTDIFGQGYRFIRSIVILKKLTSRLMMDLILCM